MSGYVAWGQVDLLKKKQDLVLYDSKPSPILATNNPATLFQCIVILILFSFFVKPLPQNMVEQKTTYNQHHVRIYSDIDMLDNNKTNMREAFFFTYLTIISKTFY